MKKKILHIALVVFSLFLSVLPMQAQFQAGQTLKIFMPESEYVLSVENSSLAVSAKAVLWNDTDTPSQCWQVYEGIGGTILLKNVYSGLYLGRTNTAVNGAPVGQLEEKKSLIHGNWLFELVEGQEGVYTIYLGTSKRNCLAAPANKELGKQLTLQREQGTDTERIRWRVQVVETKPDKLTAEVCTEMMERWKSRYYHKASVGHIIGKGGWWGDAEMFEIVLDAYETTGDIQYATMFDELYKNFCKRNGTDWSGNDYNDDIAWMCIACTRAYLLTGKEEYRTIAKSNFDKMYKRANAYGDHTLIWCMGKTGTNSCVNGPACVAACYLAMATGDDKYYQKAKNTYAGHRAKLYNLKSGKFNGHVFDSYDTENNKVGNEWASTYNQGTSMGAACMLYNRYGDKQYKDDADAIMEWTAEHLTNEYGIIKVCQTVTGDLTGFKGILMRYVRNYAACMDQPKWYDWLAKNAFHAYNNRNSEGISMSAWLTKTPEDFCFHDGGSFSDDGGGAMTALSAAFNAHLGVYRGVRQAKDTHSFAQFDYLRGVEIGDNQDLGHKVAGPYYNKYYTGYRRVDFGQDAPTHLLLQANILRAFAVIKVYADRIGETLLCEYRADAEALNQWQLHQIELDTLLTGVHDVYFELTGINKVKLAYLDTFSFGSGTSDGISSPSSDVRKPVIKFAGNCLQMETTFPSTLYIYNMTGQFVSEKTFNAGANVQSISHLPAGVYFATLLVEGKRYVQKFTVK